jgi:hypothetical protein
VPAEEGHGLSDECHTAQGGNQGPRAVFSTDYRWASCSAAERPR